MGSIGPFWTHFKKLCKYKAQFAQNWGIQKYFCTKENDLWATWKKIHVVFNLPIVLIEKLTKRSCFASCPICRWFKQQKHWHTLLATPRHLIIHVYPVELTGYSVREFPKLNLGKRAYSAKPRNSWQELDIATATYLSTKKSRDVNTCKTSLSRFFCRI